MLYFISNYHNIETMTKSEIYIYRNTNFWNFVNFLEHFLFQDRILKRKRNNMKRVQAYVINEILFLIMSFLFNILVLFIYSVRNTHVLNFMEMFIYGCLSKLKR